MAPNVIGLSCLSVGTGAGGTISMLARVSVIDHRGHKLYDVHVRPTGPVESYRTATTGVSPADLENGVPFQDVQRDVASLLQDKVIVGYQLWQDLQVLGISHPAVNTRDVGLFLPFRAALQQPDLIIGLPTLIWQFLRRKVTAGAQDSVENARAAMDLYRSHSEEWEETHMPSMKPVRRKDLDAWKDSQVPRDFSVFSEPSGIIPVGDTQSSLDDQTIPREGFEGDFPCTNTQEEGVEPGQPDSPLAGAGISPPEISLQPPSSPLSQPVEIARDTRTRATFASLMEDDHQATPSPSPVPPSPSPGALLRAAGIVGATPPRNSSFAAVPLNHPFTNPSSPSPRKSQKRHIQEDYDDNPGSSLEDLAMHSPAHPDASRNDYQRRRTSPTPLSAPLGRVPYDGLSALSTPEPGQRKTVDTTQSPSNNAPRLGEGMESPGPDVGIGTPILQDYFTETRLKTSNLLRSESSELLVDPFHISPNGESRKELANNVLDASPTVAACVSQEKSFIMFPELRGDAGAGVAPDFALEFQTQAPPTSGMFAGDYSQFP